MDPLLKYEGRVISEHPYVKLLTAPKGQLPLFPECPTKMTALAQVNETLAFIEVRVALEWLQ